MVLACVGRLVVQRLQEKKEVYQRWMGWVTGWRGASVTGQNPDHAPSTPVAVCWLNNQGYRETEDLARKRLNENCFIRPTCRDQAMLLSEAK